MEFITFSFFFFATLSLVLKIIKKLKFLLWTGLPGDKAIISTTARLTSNTEQTNQTEGHTTVHDVMSWKPDV